MAIVVKGIPLQPTYALSVQAGDKTVNLATVPLHVDLSTGKAGDIRGVYLLWNTRSRKCYVGSSERVLFRIRSHFAALAKGDHPNRKLLNAWAKYGPGTWEWAILESVPGSDGPELLSREQSWLDDLGCFCFGYNMAKFAGSPMKGRHHSEESRRKCAVAAAKLDRRDTAYRAKLSLASSGPNNWAYGKAPPPNLLAKSREANLGRKHTPGTLRKMSATAKITQKGAKNGFYGRHHTPETLTLMRQSAALRKQLGGFDGLSCQSA